jgi:2-polyprenyl-3-methyl-5-hydroxy-6-metoxy-1,4-benzoquinol methylase
MKIVGKLVDNSNQNSYSAKLRRKRFELFLTLMQSLPKPINILDLGGTQKFWEVMAFTDVSDIHITLLNLHKTEVKYGNFSALAGDATKLVGVEDNQFDIVFSNSVIEHVGGYEQQKRMAREIQRVGKRYFVQTPNYYFPIEPHFLFPGFQWLPVSVRVFLISHFSLGWVKRIPDTDEARKLIKSIRLLRKSEFLALFPEAKLYEEKLFGLAKSFIVYDGW